MDIKYWVPVSLQVPLMSDTTHLSEFSLPKPAYIIAPGLLKRVIPVQIAQ